MAIIKVKSIDGRLIMPRKNRQWYPGAIYHITARGNRRDDIFKDDKDYKYYLFCIKEALAYYENKFKIICYCLMTNHVHLQVKIEDMPLSDFIKRVNSLYAQNFNNKYNCVGHLFQGRYGAELIDTDSHNLEAARYIHLNPVRANMVSKPELYRWSSYSMYIGMYKEKLIKTDEILSYFKDRNKRKSFKEYVESVI